MWCGTIYVVRYSLPANPSTNSTCGSTDPWSVSSQQWVRSTWLGRTWLRLSRRPSRTLTAYLPWRPRLDRARPLRRLVDSTVATLTVGCFIIRAINSLCGSVQINHLFNAHSAHIIISPRFTYPGGMEARVEMVRSGDRAWSSGTHQRTCVEAAIG